MSRISGEFDFSQLSVDERITLAESLWDSIARDPELSLQALALTEEQKLELDSRLAAEEKGEIAYSPWEEVKRRLLADKK